MTNSMTVFTFENPLAMLSSMRNYFADPTERLRATNRPVNTKPRLVAEVNTPGFMSYRCDALAMRWRVNRDMVEQFPKPTFNGKKSIGEINEDRIWVADCFAKTWKWRKKFAKVFSGLTHSRPTGIESVTDPKCKIATAPYTPKSKKNTVVGVSTKEKTSCPTVASYTLLTYENPQDMFDSMRISFAHTCNPNTRLVAERGDSDLEYISYFSKELNTRWRVKRATMGNFSTLTIDGDPRLGEIDGDSINASDCISKWLKWRKKFAEVFSGMKHSNPKITITDPSCTMSSPLKAKWTMETPNVPIVTNVNKNFSVLTFTNPQAMLNSMLNWFANHLETPPALIAEANTPGFMSYRCEALLVRWRVKRDTLKNFTRPVIENMDILGHCDNNKIRASHCVAKTWKWRKRFAKVFSKMKHIKPQSAVLDEGLTLEYVPYGDVVKKKVIATKATCNTKTVKSETPVKKQVVKKQELKNSFAHYFLNIKSPIRAKNPPADKKVVKKGWISSLLGAVWGA